MTRSLSQEVNPSVAGIRISGAKNASLAVLCATFLSQETRSSENIPEISDVRVMIEIINSLGANCQWEKF